jgi:hypothetical protein
MEIKVWFLGGPLGGQMAMTDHLDRMKCFFDDRQRLALVYIRENETDYVYDLKRSQSFTKVYDKAKAEVMASPAPSLRFFDERPFSDTEITEADVADDLEGDDDEDS